MSLVAAADESIRNRVYFVGAVVFEGSSGHAVDQMVRSDRQAAQQKIHFKRESDSRRTYLLRHWLASGLVRAWCYSAPLPGQSARQTCVGALALDAVKHDVRKLVLELGDPVRNQRDVKAIHPIVHSAGAPIAYSHEAPGSYCPLEIADGITWAFGAGGAWRRLIAPMVDVERQFES